VAIGIVKPTVKVVEAPSEVIVIYIFPFKSITIVLGLPG
jgi:hypothetical protein